MTTRGLVQRIVAVDVGPPGVTGRRFDGLRTSFRIEHRAEREPSLGSISVYNLSRESIGLFRPRTNVIRLFAGYDGIAQLAFQGNPLRDGVEVRNEGNGDVVTTIEASDGGAGYATGFINASYAQSVPWEQVLQSVLDATGWTRGQIDLAPGLRLPFGVVLVGGAREILPRLEALVQPSGGRAFVRDNALYIVRNGAGTTESALLISSTQGNLIGSPTSTRRGVDCTALLDATMRPGRRFQIQHPDVTGNYVCNDVVFTGDSWSGSYYMRLTGNALGVS